VSLCVCATQIRANPSAAGEVAEGSEWLPLHAALQAKAPSDVISALLEAHPEAVHAVGCYGWTALHIAARRGADEGVLRMLLDANPAAAHAVAESGDTPLTLAQKRAHSAATRVLREVEERRRTAREEENFERERAWWTAQDREHARRLSAATERKVEELEMARRLAAAGTAPAEAAGKADLAESAEVRHRQLSEAIEGMRLQLEHERAQRELLEQKIAQDQAQHERRNASKEVQKPRDEGDAPKGAGEWTTHKAKSGKTFWYNAKTKKSTWVDPNL
jgi:hypothetical protein